MTLKNDAKFEEELTCALKNDVRNLAKFGEFHWRTQNLKSLHFEKLFCGRYVELKNCRGIMS